jgi:hypothetical protein
MALKPFKSAVAEHGSGVTALLTCRPFNCYCSTGQQVGFDRVFTRLGEPMVGQMAVFVLERVEAQHHNITT